MVKIRRLILSLTWWDKNSSVNQFLAILYNHCKLFVTSAIYILNSQITWNCQTIKDMIDRLAYWPFDGTSAADNCSCWPGVLWPRPIELKANILIQCWSLLNCARSKICRKMIITIFFLGDSFRLQIIKLNSTVIMLM